MILCRDFSTPLAYTAGGGLDAALDRPSRIRLWVSRESRARELVIDHSVVLVDGELGYGAVWLSPYNHRKDPTVAFPCLVSADWRCAGLVM